MYVWKSRGFLLCSLFLTCLLFGFVLLGLADINQEVLGWIYRFIVVIGVICLLLGSLSLISSDRAKKVKLAATFVTLMNIVIFLFLF
ncbi:hypothetical protein [Pontibacillus halophilus]|uniref:hypothetical protein n=1 Tax=Pontibacillus halophilus TaxID=516704 RepID=UPI00047C890A|nr:hypothetical protein [Pontibacillus halophilus]